VVVVVLGLVFGTDLTQLVTGSGTSGVPPGYEGDEQAEFVSVILADTEDVWAERFQAMGNRYQPPTLVLFSDAVQSACGYAQAAVGPFYCPGDRKVYLDLAFFRDLDQRHGAPGDFAQAYVIAHEVGHHIQTLLGISARVHQQRQALSQVEANALSVRQELQADCFAGVWAHYADHARDLLEEGDIEEGLRAASAVGDDTLQRRAQGRIQPETWTHGSAAQRVRWFRRGYEQGRIEACDTFSARSL
jgi:predicted metalloprotease